jgi:pyruvate formate lyase activating enzyme
VGYWQGSIAIRSEALLFNIQRFSLHDGPGIRTTVFFKGCPLQCRWCSNPESWNPFIEVMTRDAKCIRCGRCAEMCPLGAISFTPESGRKIDWTKCDNCLRCVDVCPSGAITKAGWLTSVDEVMAEVRREAVFYRHSGGGVTLSGGEPLLQPRIAFELLKACKQEGINTALDTSGYASWELLQQILEYSDMVLYDIKHLNPQHHRRGTGRSNSTILKNARRAAQMTRMWLRIPLVPGYNDSPEHLIQVGEFGAQLGVEKICLLPYHRWGETKCENLGRKSLFQQRGPLSEVNLEEARLLLEASGREVVIGE